MILDEYAVQVLFEMASMIADKSCTMRSSITFTAILKSQNSVSWKDESGNAFTSRFVCETEMMWFRTKIMWFKNRNDAIWKINDVI